MGLHPDRTVTLVEEAGAEARCLGVRLCKLAWGITVRGSSSGVGMELQLPRHALAAAWWRACQ